MTSTNIQYDLQAPGGPLSAVEKKLVGWSLGTGLALLFALVLINHYAPSGL